MRRNASHPLLIAVVLCCAGTGARAASYVVVGDAETVFAWESQRCDAQDIPDAPARAFRDSGETVHLFAPHFVNRALTGGSLDSVTPDCRITFEGGSNDDPAALDDRIWLTSFHTSDGITIHALGHAEYHGHRRPGCAGGRYMDCWWNGVVQLVSTDAGASFRRAASGKGIVAAPPYTYDGKQGRPTGYFSPSNIVELDGFHYAFIFAAAQGEQRRGACLLRTDRIADPTRWRAWDGDEFTVRLSGAYAGAGQRPEEHVCTPVAGIPSTLTSVTRQPDGTFMGLFAASRPLVAGGAAVTGVYAISSRDLLRWSEPKLLLAVPMMFDFGCDAPSVHAYPSLLDPDSPSRTFATIGDRPYLYLTRFNVRDCRLGMNRDLVRFRLVAEEEPASGGAGR
jgi:hypothetical protein